VDVRSRLRIAVPYVVDSNSSAYPLPGESECRVARWRLAQNIRSPRSQPVRVLLGSCEAYGRWKSGSRTDTRARSWILHHARGTFRTSTVSRQSYCLNLWSASLLPCEGKELARIAGPDDPTYCWLIPRAMICGRAVLSAAHSTSDILLGFLRRLTAQHADSVAIAEAARPLRLACRLRAKPAAKFGMARGATRPAIASRARGASHHACLEDAILDRSFQILPHNNVGGAGPPFFGCGTVNFLLDRLFSPSSIVRSGTVDWHDSQR
jgi:hypothetical protein